MSASAGKIHPAVQAGRDAWQPHAELRAIRDRLDQLELNRELDSRQLDITVELLTRLVRSFDDRLLGVENRLCAIEGRDRKAGA